MATRLYLPATGAAVVSPPISAADWNAHINTDRRPLNFVNGGSTIATLTFTPDAADHLVAGRAHFVQFVSDVLPPQTIAAQTVKLQVRVAEANAGNNLFLNWMIKAVSEDGQTVLGTLLEVKADALEAGTALANRLDTATTMAFSTTTQNFRLVLELGLGGTPVNTTGVQGHNGSMSFGESAATDLPEDDASTAALNPWLQFTQNIKLWNPQPAQSGWGRAEVAIAKGDPASPAGWTVGPILMTVFIPTDHRVRFTQLFNMIRQIEFDHDDILILMTDLNLSAPQIARLKELRASVVKNACLLEGGLRLSDLTPAQIAARVG